MKKVIYFTAGDVPTTDEAAEIAALQARAAPLMEVAVRNAKVNNSFGAGPEPADYVAGTRPTAYSNTGTYPAPPAGLAPANGAAINVRNSTAAKTVAGAAVVAAGVITSVDLPGSAYPVTDGQAITGVTMSGTAGAGKTATFTITNGVITAIAFT